MFDLFALALSQRVAEMPTGDDQVCPGWLAHATEGQSLPVDKGETGFDEP